MNTVSGAYLTDSAGERAARHTPGGGGQSGPVNVHVLC